MIPFLKWSFAFKLSFGKGKVYQYLLNFGAVVEVAKKNYSQYRVFGNPNGN